MKKDTAIKIFKTMVIIILVLIMGIMGEVHIISHKNMEINRQQVEIEKLTEQIQQLEQHIKDLEQSHTEEYANFEYAGEFTLTAYCTEKYEHICGGGHGITASGQPVQAGLTVAVGDTDKFPYGTILYIEGVGVRIVQDTGAGLHDNQIDLAVDTHADALNWGRQYNHKVYVVKVGEGQ